MADNDKPDYSWSALKTFTLCAHSYYLQYIAGRVCRGNYFTLRGQGVHKAREANFLQKIKSGIDLPVDDCLDAVRDEIADKISTDQIDLHCEQLDGMGKAAAGNKILNDTVPLVTRDHKALYHKTQPRHIEQQIPIELPDEPFDLFGIVDLIDDKYRVGDAKVSKKRLSAEQVASDMQMTIYWLLATTFLRRNVPSGYFDLIYTGRPISAQRFPWQRNHNDVKKVLARFRTMHASIQAGNFPPADPGHWKCNPKWCAFYDECKYT